jgi:hypothetical protein
VDVSTPDEFFLAVYTLNDDETAVAGLNTAVKTINITADLDMTDWDVFDVSGKTINLGETVRKLTF